MNQERETGSDNSGVYGLVRDAGEQCEPIGNDMSEKAEENR